MEEARLLEDYLSEIARLGVMSAGEDADLLLRQAREGDAVARSRFIDSLLPLTATVAMRECPPWMRPLDAIQEANVVLLTLVDDPDVTDPEQVLAAAVQSWLASMHPDSEVSI